MGRVLFVPEGSTPGEALPDSLINEQLVLLLDNLRVSELMFNPPGGSRYEYVELMNTGDVPMIYQCVSLRVFVLSFLKCSSSGQQVLIVANIADLLAVMVPG